MRMATPSPTVLESASRRRLVPLVPPNGRLLAPTTIGKTIRRTSSIRSCSHQLGAAVHHDVSLPALPLSLLAGSWSGRAAAEQDARDGHRGDHDGQAPGHGLGRAGPDGEAQEQPPQGLDDRGDRLVVGDPCSQVGMVSTGTKALLG
jgi:hypothetical protein